MAALSYGGLSPIKGVIEIHGVVKDQDVYYDFTCDIAGTRD